MNETDIKRFYDKMNRLIKGDLTSREKDLRKRANETYETIIKNHGGKNPIIGL